MTDQPRVVNAGNEGLFTLDGTRTYLVGDESVAVIDPGPDVHAHVRALSSAVAAARRVSIVLTHGHADHAAAARPLAEAIGADVWGPDGLPEVDHALRDGDEIQTDAGPLVAIATPGHTRDHLCFEMPSQRALFAGDFVLGHGDTTWVAEYPGCVADYLRSIDRVRACELDVIYPAHGPPLSDPTAALDRFERHRRGRIERVRAVLDERPSADLEDVLEAVYGASVPPIMMGAARKSLGALVEHVRATEA